jgi:hypothetical protein
MSRRIAGLGCAAMLLIVGAEAWATTWDPTADFTLLSGNPNGVWTYGSMDTNFKKLTPYGNQGLGSGVNPAWYGWNGDWTPGIWRNMTGGTFYGISTGQLSLHPGPGTEPGLLRWTAPPGVTGQADIGGRFLPGDIGGMTVAVRKNNAPVWSATDAGSFDLRLSIAPGDTIDFAVYEGYWYGNTELRATITAAPEPAAFATLVIGVTGVQGLHRRQCSVRIA